MPRFLLRTLICLVGGWFLGVDIMIRLYPESNLAPLIGICTAVPLVYLLSFLVVPIFTSWLDRLR